MGVVEVRRKSTSSARRSAEITVSFPACDWITAASSPMPTTTDECWEGLIAWRSLLIKSNSVREWVREGGAVDCRSCSFIAVSFTFKVCDGETQSQPQWFQVRSRKRSEDGLRLLVQTRCREPLPLARAREGYQQLYHCA